MGVGADGGADMGGNEIWDVEVDDAAGEDAGAAAGENAAGIHLIAGAGAGSAAAALQDGDDQANHQGGVCDGGGGGETWSLQLLLQYLAETDEDAPSIAIADDFAVVVVEHMLAREAWPV